MRDGAPTGAHQIYDDMALARVLTFKHLGITLCFNPTWKQLVDTS